MDVLIEIIKDIIVATCMVICSIVAPIKTALIVLGVCALFIYNGSSWNCGFLN